MKNTQLISIQTLVVVALFSFPVWSHNKVVVVPLFDDDTPVCNGTLTAGRWCDHGDGTVTDQTTQLTWLKRGNWGANFILPVITRPFSTTTLTDITIFDQVQLLSSGSANSSLSDGSVSGQWRISSYAEMDYFFSSPGGVSSTSTHPFVGLETLYWTASTMVTLPGQSLVIGPDGIFGFAPKSNEYPVWPVKINLAE